MRAVQAFFILVLFLSFMSAGCTSSDGPEQIIVPQYPGAVEDQEHNMKTLGMSLVKVKRLITSDSYDKVLAFYREQLKDNNPEVATYTLEDGRQTAMTIKGNRDRSITIAIQEFKKEGKVAITYMRVGP